MSELFDEQEPGEPGPGAESEPALDASAPVVAEPQQQAQGPLLDEQDEEKVRALVVQLVKDQAPQRKRRRAEWQRNALWMKGVRGVKVRRLSEDRNDVELVVPLGAYDVPPVLDRTKEMCRKYVSHLLTDPPVPDAEPATDSDADRDAADFTTRLLTVEGAESGFNNLGTIRRAALKSTIFSSGFIYDYVDPMGNGWQPMECQAHPLAPNKDAALIDPTTQQPAQQLITRYVREDGSLTDEKGGAAKQWLPKIVSEILTGEQVVLVPADASGIHEAKGAVLIRWTTVGALKGAFPDVAQWDEESLRQLAEWRPEESSHARRGVLDGKDARARVESTDGEGKVRDSAECCVLVAHYTSHGTYPKGAYVVVCGSDQHPVLHRQPWSGVVETAEGAVDEECLPIPLTQVRLLDDLAGDDHMGDSFVGAVGPADEVRGQIVLAWLDHMERGNTPNLYLPLGSIVSADQVNRRDGTPIYYNPQGKPEFEKIDPFPADAKEFFDRATDHQNSASGLEDTAQGAETSQATSGVAKQIVVQQSHINVGESRGNLADAIERRWRVVAQLMRVFYTVPQKVKLEGEDGAFKLKEWSRADLGSTKDIKIARGSFTQQSPEQKQQQLDARLQLGTLDPEEYQRLSANNLRPVIGWQDNPHRLRVKRQIAAWREGPPEGYQPPQPQIVQGPMGPVQQETPDPANPFADIRPVDDEQDVARIRWLELRREVAGTQMTKKPQPWAQHLLAAYDRARRAAGIATLFEQQQAQAQAAAQQQQQAAAQQQQEHGAKAASEDKKLGAQQQESEAQRAFQAEQQDAKQRHELNAQAMQAQGDPMAGVMSR
jgi:hypothetical protein